MGGEEEGLCKVLSLFAAMIDVLNGSGAMEENDICFTAGIVS